jgi:hypothetical protein
MRDYLKNKINEFAMNSKNTNIRDLYRGITEFKRRYICDLSESHDILSMWKNNFSQLLHILNVTEIVQLEIYTAEPRVQGPSHRGYEVATAKLKKYESPLIDQIPADMNHSGDETAVSAIHLE